MSRPKIRIHNVESDEIIDREMNDAEFEQYQIDQANWESEQEAKAEAKIKRQALLVRLGITEEEAKLLLA